MANPEAQRESCKARAALLWGLAGFVALQVGLAVAIERWLPELRDPEYGYRLRRLYPRTAAAHERPFTVVMLGSSRTTLGFKAGALEPILAASLGRPVVVFNFGITGAGPVTQLIDLRRLLDQGIRPDLLLIEILPPLLAGQFPHEASRLPATRLWLGELPLVGRFGGSVEALRAAWWKAWPLPCYAHRFAIVSRLAPACLPYQLRMDWAYRIDASGWVNSPVGRSTPEHRRLAVERARLEYVGYLVGFRLGGPAGQALREELELCRSRGIATALVLMPEGSEFRSWYPPTAWAQIETFLSALGREYAAPVLNARGWIADEDFADSHHLLPQGAARFTERLGREALLPLIQQIAISDQPSAISGPCLPEGRQGPAQEADSSRRTVSHAKPADS